MNVAVTGATGFVGKPVVEAFTKAGHRLHALSRNPTPEILAPADAVIHLAGEPIAQRWTAEAKHRIYSSRVDGTRNLVNAISKNTRRPEVLVCASAVGIYGSRGDEILTEQSPPGTDFLAGVVVDSENSARLAESFGVRVVSLRFGVVLGNGGALSKMLPLFRLGVGGRLGSGKQWMSWVHIDDVVRLILFSVERGALQGALNTTAPNPVTNAEFTRELAAVVDRPAILPVPAFALKLALGEMADVALASQRVLPKAVFSHGFEFQYSQLAPALANILAK